MAGDFAERMDELSHLVGEGTLTGSVTVDQVYAHVQHEDLTFNHPHGGHALYLQQPLMDKHEGYLRKIADRLLEDGPVPAMAEAMEDLAEDGGVAVHAPLDFGDLRESGHPEVTSNGETVYDRAPRQHRLTEEELRAKSRARWPELPDRLKGWIYWHKTARGRSGLPPPRRH